MYKRNLTQEEKERVRAGDTKLLLSILHDSDQIVTKELKQHKGDVAFQQGVSHIIDKLIEVLKIPS